MTYLFIGRKSMRTNSVIKIYSYTGLLNTHNFRMNIIAEKKLEAKN